MEWKPVYLGVVTMTMLIATGDSLAVSFTTPEAAKTITDDTGTQSTCQDIFVNFTPAIVHDIVLSVETTHTWVGDLRFDLSHLDSGNVLTVMNRPGRTSGSSNGNPDNLNSAYPIIYDDYAQSGIPAENMGDDGDCDSPVIGDPVGQCPADNYFPAPDPGDGGLGSSFAGVFKGTNGFATWRLCAGDYATGIEGTLTSWSMHLRYDNDSDGLATKNDLDPTNASNFCGDSTTLGVSVSGSTPAGQTQQCAAANIVLMGNYVVHNTARLEIFSHGVNLGRDTGGGVFAPFRVETGAELRVASY